MDDYYLFLDETMPNACGKYFGLGGYAIRKSDYEAKLIPKLTKIKNALMPDPNLPLHLYDMRKNKNGFEFLVDSTLRNKLFEELKNLLLELDITVFGVSIDSGCYKSMYMESSTNDVYSISLQIILENFVHFLISRNGIGSFFIESRLSLENKALQITYFRLLTNGTLYFNSKTIMERLTMLNFPLKSDNSDNILGVQLADFIPITLLRHLNGSKDYYGLYSVISPKIYRGYNNCMQNRYGFKNLL